MRLLIYWPERFARLAPDLTLHASAEIRRTMAWNMGMLAKYRPELVSNDVRNALLRLLGDQESSVRAEAAVACGRARITEAVPEIVALLAARPADLDHWTDHAGRLDERRVVIEARCRYAFAFGLLGASRPSVVHVLIDAVLHRAIHQDVIGIGADGRHGPISPDIRGQAAQALTHVEHGDTLSLIKQLLCDSEPQARRSAVLACLRRSDPQYRQLLEAKAPWAVPWWDAQHL